MSALLWLLAGIPLITGGVLAVAGRAANRVAPAVGVAAAVATLGLAIATAVDRPTASAPLFAGIEAGLRVDGLSAVMVITVAAVTTAVLVFSAGQLDRTQDRGRFFGLMLLFAGAMLVTVTATTVALLLMAWEVMGATSWALIGFWWYEPHRVRAADTAFLTTRAADLGLYLAAGAAVAGGVGSLHLDALSTADSPWLHVATVGVVLAALGKSAQLPFSFWLSRAMEGPSPVSALLHSAAMVAAGAYLLLRLHPLLAATAWAELLVAWAGAATALLLGVVAVAQTDLKQLLAASTCAQVGFMVLAAGAAGVAGGTAHLVAHAAVKAGLFLAVGAWLTALGTKHLSALCGAARSYPLVGACFAVSTLALAGLAPLSLWATKDEVLAAAYQQSTVLYAVGLAAAAVSAVYSVKALWYVLRPVPDDAASRYDTEQQGTRKVAVAMRPPLLVLAFGAATLGVLALPDVSEALRSAVGTPGEPSPQPWELGLSAGVAFAAAGIAWWRGPRPVPGPAAARRWAGAWLGLEQAAHFVVVRPVMGLARATAAFDDRIVDGAVRQVARGGLAAARLAGRVDDGGIDALVSAVAAGARRLGQWARRPQTGLLHQYYAQAAVGFAVLVLILLLVR
ncbi:NADH-quinone oxidoreductase subunit L [Streptomyces sp. TRM68367]|uniref:NADH-quinone oxidoreductase subunit 5 family protein n=1 Tax=Streptomyces sp. TRM68367 TaxID=2758415 RepID=UPI00165B52B4|nr:proton-conducting transporter membrane subunit [Streptomyces sp. TRM68367]MBC9725044.1 NADH-quinone oxidoreductase subunit L [Streptomyces sp. TRM68367]